MAKKLSTEELSQLQMKVSQGELLTDEEKDNLLSTGGEQARSLLRTVAKQGSAKPEPIAAPPGLGPIASAAAKAMNVPEKAPTLPTVNAMAPATESAQETPKPLKELITATKPAAAPAVAEVPTKPKVEKKEQKKEKVAVQAIEKEEDPFESLQQSLIKSKNLNEEEKIELQKKQNEVSDKLGLLRQVYQDKLDTAKSEADKQQAVTGWLQAAETIGNALVQMGAAKEGLKKGVDLSNIKLSKQDWNQNYDRILRELEANRRQLMSQEEISKEPLKEEQRTLASSLKAREGRTDELEDKKIQIGLAALQQKAREKESAAERASRERIAGMQTASREEIAAARADALKGREEERAKAKGEITAEKGRQVVTAAKEKLLSAMDLPKKSERIKAADDEIAKLAAAGVLSPAQAAKARELASEGRESFSLFGKKRQEELADLLGGAGTTSAGQVPQGKVQVRSPDGKLGFIPQAQLEAAKRQGYTEVP